MRRIPVSLVLPDHNTSDTRSDLVSVCRPSKILTLQSDTVCRQNSQSALPSVHAWFHGKALAYLFRNIHPDIHKNPQTQEGLPDYTAGNIRNNCCSCCIRLVTSSADDGEIMLYLTDGTPQIFVAPARGAVTKGQRDKPSLHKFGQ